MGKFKSKPKTLHFCGYCVSHGYVSKIKVKEHFRRTHPENIPFLCIPDETDDRTCVHCGGIQPLMTRQNFLSHVRGCVKNSQRHFIKHGELFKCNYCGTTFRRKNNYKTHLKKFHEGHPDISKVPEIVVSKDPEYTDNFQKFIRDELDPANLVVLSSREKQKSTILGAKATKLSFRFSELALRISTAGLFHDVIQKTFNYLADLHHTNDSDLMCASLMSNNYLTFPIFTAVTKSRDFQIKNLLNRLEAVVQSFGDLSAQSDLTLEFTSTDHSEVGRPLNPKKFHNLIEFLNTKKGYLDLGKCQSKDSSHDKACLPLSLAIALYYEALHNFYYLRWYRNNNLPPVEIIALAQTIYDIIGQPYNTTIELIDYNLNKIQQWLSQTYGKNLEVFKLQIASLKEIVLLFPERELNDDNTISLLAVNDHVGLITCKETFFGTKIYNKRIVTASKKGLKQCNLCKSFECFTRTGGDTGARKILCQDCNIRFKNQFCYNVHKECKKDDVNVCQKFFRCNTCLRYVKRTKGHKCGSIYCKTCKKDVKGSVPGGQQHKCFTAPIEPKKTKNNLIHLVYDIECKRIGDKLIPNLFIVFRSCPQCFQNHNPHIDFPCCGKRCHAYKGENCMIEAVKYMFFSDFKKAIALAHYSSGFDAGFILETLLAMNHVPKVVSDGLKILKLEYRNVACIDSYMFFRAKLAKLPEMFGFPQRKTFFPHEFNCDESYDGNWPTEEMFSSVKTENELTELREWLNNQKQIYPQFNYQQQLERYCLQDVIVLHLAVAEFRSLILTYANCEPFEVAFTLAGLAGYVYRLGFVEPDRIAVLSDYGTLSDKTQSHIATCFLKWLKLTKYPDLQCAFDGPEVKIGKFKLDGYSTSRNLAVEFNGCHWHGCLKKIHGCRSGEVHPSYKPYTYEDVHRITMEREEDLKKSIHGLQIETFWECEVTKMSDFQAWLTQTDDEDVIVKPITSLREGLYGGRVEVSLPLVEIGDENEEEKYCIKYKDANHLYPSVQLSSSFPIGHPTIVNGWELPNHGRDFTAQACDSNFGLVKVKVVYPAIAPILYHAILPYHNQDGKLIFGLCRTCSNEQRHGIPCNHIDDDTRSWVGTYCTPELKLAIENGYNVLRVYQILKYDSKDICNDIFEPFMKKWLKLKYQASGYPSGYNETEEMKLEFLKLLFENEGILLNSNEICDPTNPALKTMTKCLINALWGKMGENRINSSSTTKFVKTRAALTNILKDYKTNVKAMRLFGGDFMLVETRTKPEYVSTGPMNNAVIASFVTTYARCLLWNYLAKLKSRVIYCDTDSIIYYQRKGQDEDPIKTGPFTHQWKDEVTAGIKSFASMSPKNYIYEMDNGEFRWKCKGLSMSGVATNVFNYSIAKKCLAKVSPLMLDVLLDDFYEKIENPQKKEQLKSEYLALIAKNPTKINTLIFDDSVCISRQWKKPGESCRIYDNRTKRISVIFDKRSVFRAKQFMLDSIVKIRSLPFGVTRYMSP